LCFFSCKKTVTYLGTCGFFQKTVTFLGTCVFFSSKNSEQIRPSELLCKMY
jgi:hypothetical protein